MGLSRWTRWSGVAATAVAAITIATATARVATAQGITTLELGAFGHYTSVNNDAELGGHSTGFGGRAGIFLSRYFEAELEYGRGTVQTGGGRYSDNAWFPIRYFGTANIPVGTRTKLLLGAGLVDTYKGDITRNEFEEGWSLLGGVRVCFGDAWSVRPEAVFDKTPSPQWLQRNYLFRPPGDPTSTRVQFRIGISRFIGHGQSSCVRHESRNPVPPAAPPAPVVTPPPPPPPPRPTASLTATPSQIVAGDRATLTWTSSNARTCTAPWASDSSSSGTQSIAPASTATFSITCTGPGGTASASASVSVTQPPPPPPPPPAAQRAALAEFFTLSGVHFDFDKSTIKPSGKARLDSAVIILNMYPDAKVEVQGHTDSIGTSEYNMGLSWRRAGSVRDYLVSKGIDPARLTTKGYGETRPAATNSTREGRALNRRVVLIEIRN